MTEICLNIHASVKLWIMIVTRMTHYYTVSFVLPSQWQQEATEVDLEARVREAELAAAEVCETRSKQLLPACCRAVLLSYSELSYSE